MLKRGQRALRTVVGRTRWILPVCTVFAVLLMAITAAADSTQEGVETTSWLSVGGLAFFDLYHVVSHHTTEGDGATGTVLRRGYLTFDGDYNETLFGRLLFEVNQHFRITPNTCVTAYDENDQGVRPDTDLAIRLTFSLNFE